MQKFKQYKQQTKKQNSDFLLEVLGFSKKNLKNKIRTLRFLGF